MSEQKEITKHGVFIDVLGLGVLLVGTSGIGKSELALGLINRGHRLVADDSVIFTRQGVGKIIGSCPSILQDFLEVRGLGILNIRVMYGDTAIKLNKRLQLIVNVVQVSPEALNKIDRLAGMCTEQDILGVNIPQVSIPVAPGRNLAVLVECAVRNQVQKLTGYRAVEEFCARQRAAISSKGDES